MKVNAPQPSQWWVLHLPNMLTAARVVCAAALLMLEPLSGAFLIVHGLGALSDGADGFMARRFNSQSAGGAIFDSLADALYVAVLLLVLIPYFSWSVWIVSWVVLVIAIRLAAVAVGFARFRELVFLHTYANKVAGTLILCVPFLLLWFSSEPIIIAVCVLATVSAVEELAIIASTNKLDRDVTSIVQKAAGRD